MSTTIECRNGNYILTDGDVTTTITAITKDGKSLILPENASGRKFFALSKFEKSEKHDLIGINRDPNPDHASHLSKKKMVELMTDEERELYNTTIANAEAIVKGIFDAVAARNTKTLTPEEKLRAKIAKLEAQLAAMNNEGQA